MLASRSKRKRKIITSIGVLGHIPAPRVCWAESMHPLVPERNWADHAEKVRSPFCGCPPRPHGRHRLASKTLMRCQVAPLAYRQITQHDFADAHPFEAYHFQTHMLAHTPDLAFFAFMQHKAQLLGILPFHFGVFKGLTVQL